MTQGAQCAGGTLLGFTTTATATLHRDVEQGAAPAPPRGVGTPGQGHGRANSEET